jgi:shikimate kinase
MKTGNRLNSIVLLGPPRVGKTTVAYLIAEKLNLKVISLDELIFKIYKIYNYDYGIEEEIRRNGDLKDLFEYWKPFEIKTVEYALTNNSMSIFDFGAGYIIYNNPTLSHRIRRLLLDYRNTFYLVPSSDMHESVKEISQRFQNTEKKEVECLDYFFDASCQRLAKYTINTKNKSPLQIRDEILAIYDN